MNIVLSWVCFLSVFTIFLIISNVFCLMFCMLLFSLISRSSATSSLFFSLYRIFTFSNDKYFEFQGLSRSTFSQQPFVVMVSRLPASQGSPRIPRTSYPSAFYIIYILQDQLFCSFILALLVFHSLDFPYISGFLFLLIKGKTHFFSSSVVNLYNRLLPLRGLCSDLWLSLISVFCWDCFLYKLILSFRDSLRLERRSTSQWLQASHVYFELFLCSVIVHYPQLIYLRTNYITYLYYLAKKVTPKKCTCILGKKSL